MGEFCLTPLQVNQREGTLKTEPGGPQFGGRFKLLACLISTPAGMLRHIDACVCAIFLEDKLTGA